MKVTANEQVIPVDIDDTLIVWGPSIPGLHRTISVKDPHSETILTLRVHEPHLKIVESRLSRGALLIVWSAGGYAWAEAVIKGLGLDIHENIHIYSKPIAYIDDKKANDWMGDHIYLHPDSNYGKT